MSGAAQITIDFQGYWLSGTGGSGAGDADVFAYRDRHGCPAMPMTQIKGILRESAGRIWERGDARINMLFGWGDSSGEQQGALRFAGDASIADAAWYAAHFDHRAALFAVLRSTHLEQGVAKRNSLRGVEVALPMRISGVVQHTGEGDDWRGDLAQICAATIALGKESHRGLGQAIVSCEHADIGADVSFDAPSEHRLCLHLTCKDPAVFSQSGGTEGRHRTQAGPPGSALWGWAIEQCSGSPDLLAALLAGKVRFSDAVPLAGEVPVYPRPANLFAPKHDQDSQSWWVGREAYQAEPANKDKQAETMGHCHLSADLQTRWHAERRHRVRTAIEDGKAAEGQLFGIEAVAAPPSGYRVEIDATGAGLETVQWQAVCRAFARPLILGKSRNAGFGGEYLPQQVDAPPYPGGEVAVSETVLIRALSDLAIVNPWGQLSLPPAPENFGLAEDWSFDPSASAITTRRFAPWDRKLKGRGSEICVIEAGSVIAYTGGAKQSLTSKPVGTGQERGFGQWTVIKPDHASPHDFKFCSDGMEDTVKLDSVLHAVADRIARERDTTERDKWIACLANEEHQFRNGPSRSQWGLVEAELRKTSDAATLLRALGEDCDEKKPLDDTSWKSIRIWLFTQIAAMKDWPAAHRQFALAELIRNARRHAPRGKRED